MNVKSALNRLIATACAGLASLVCTTHARAAFAKGADIGWLQQMEANGYIFKNKSGVTENLLTILKEYQIDSVRLRTWVNPSSSPTDGHCSEAETVAMAKRCYNAGFRILIDFHFGDTWNSKGVQNPPAAWSTMSYTTMKSTIGSYVNHFMNDLKSNGVTPEWVQIGNEENLGICLPTGSMSGHPDQCTGLLNAAYDNVKLVFPSCKVCIHLASPQDLSSQEAWYDSYKAHGGKWDVCAFSSYPSASLVASLVGDIDTIGKRYGKQTMVVEVGGKETDPNGTYATVSNYISGMQNIGGLGVFYWEPEGYSPFTGYTMGAWDPNTKEPTHAMDAFLTGTSTATYYKFQNAATGLYIDGMGRTTVGSDCGQYGGSTSTNQQWALIASGSNFRLQNRATGLYLDGMGRTTNGSTAGQYSSSTSTNQQWVKTTSGSYVRFQNVATGLYLDGLGATTNGSALGQWSSSTSSNQLWSAQPQ